MGRNGAGRQKPHLVQQRYGAHSIPLLHLTQFILRLGEVNHQGQILLFGKLTATLQPLGGDGIGGVRRNGHLHQRRVGTPFTGPQDRLKGRIDGRLKAVRTDQRTHTHLVKHLDRQVALEVHLHHRRHTAQEQFGHPQTSCQGDIVGRLSLFEGPDAIVEPSHQGNIVGRVALQGHTCVAVGVDQARHQEFSPTIDHPTIGMPAEILLGHFVRGQEGSNAPLGHRHRPHPRLRFVGLGGHRHHPYIVKKQRLHSLT